MTDKVLAFEELQLELVILTLEKRCLYRMLTKGLRTMSIKHVLPTSSSPKIIILRGLGSFGLLERSIVKSETKSKCDFEMELDHVDCQGVKESFQESRLPSQTR